MDPEIDTRSYTVVEVIVTYVSLGWAFVMLINNNAFDKSDNFSRMESIVGDEWVVGVICLILAIVKITGIVIKNTKLRWTGLILSTILWVSVSATFLLSADGLDLNTGFIIYSAIAVMSLWTAKELTAHDRT